MNDMSPMGSPATSEEPALWPTVGHPGRVPLAALVPDPGQPRKYFDEDELDALAETMREENGGEQREILTARELTDEEKASHPSFVHYAIVSGERRWRAAPRAGLTDIEIRVKKYAARRDVKLDMYMLNQSRVGLSDIEDADYVAELAQEFGWETQAEIAIRIGKTQAWVRAHMTLLKLSPKARALMSPKLTKQRRLKIHVGGLLSRLSHTRQDDLAERLPKGDRVTATEQVRWIREQLKGTPDELPGTEFKPSILRRIVGYFGQQTSRRCGELASMENVGRLFENSSADEREAFLSLMRGSLGTLQRFILRIEGFTHPGVPTQQPRPPAPASAVQPTPVVRPSQQPVSSSVRPAASTRPAAAPSGKASAKPVTRPQQNGRPAPIIPAGTRLATSGSGSSRPLPAVGKPNSETRPIVPASSPLRTPEPAVDQVGASTFNRSRVVTVNYFSAQRGSLAMKAVTLPEYVELWDKGLLDFQRQGRQKPSYLPTREEAEAALTS